MRYNELFCPNKQTCTMARTEWRKCAAPQKNIARDSMKCEKHTCTHTHTHDNLVTAKNRIEYVEHNGTMLKFNFCCYYIPVCMHKSLYFLICYDVPISLCGFRLCPFCLFLIFVPLNTQNLHNKFSVSDSNEMYTQNRWKSTRIYVCIFFCGA